MPFTEAQFLEVFKQYNISVFPVQILLILLACSILFLLLYKPAQYGSIISAGLCLLWGWTGIVYHIIFFSVINKAAYAFGVLFIIQSAIFLYQGVIIQSIRFEMISGWKSLLGILMLIYSLLIYPVLGYVGGHGYPYQPTFGLPCPTTIFTFGVLLFASDRIRYYVFIIPFLWALLGFTAALKLGITEDIGLLVSGIMTVSVFLIQKRTNPVHN